MKKTLIPVPLPEIAASWLESLQKRRPDRRHPNLLGDRDLEWAYVAARIPPGNGEAIDFGSGDSPLALTASLRGWNVTALDLLPINFPYIRTNLNTARGDFFEYRGKDIGLIINCSTVEHVGIKGRYGVSSYSANADLRAMAAARKMLSPTGIMILTIPVGVDGEFPPACRVYGERRLPLLLEGFKVEEEIYWGKDDSNRWIETPRERALNLVPRITGVDPMRTFYNLGCFVLHPA